MTDAAEMARHYQRLREAAINVLEVLDEAGDDPQVFRAALMALHHAIREEDPPSDLLPQNPTRDPGLHLLTRYDYSQEPKRPVTLEQEAANITRRLAADRPLGDPDNDVQLTGLRAMIIGGLLKELAVRLSRGPAFGPSRHGEALARVATDLSWELLDQTFVGRQNG